MAVAEIIEVKCPKCATLQEIKYRLNGKDDKGNSTVELFKEHECFVCKLKIFVDGENYPPVIGFQKEN